MSWTVDDIDWSEFVAAKVDPALLKTVKAAALVEFNGGDYATYLCNVFSDDPVFQAAARSWALEEVRHGEALARWARLADPDFDFDAAVRRFRDGYKLPLDAAQSVRGSRAGELIARCMVEVGTSSYYTALTRASDEPVLQDICRRIASDELRHYKMFYDHLKRYQAQERMGRWRRLSVALGRMGEVDDDEIAYAYYAANEPSSQPYDRKRASARCVGQALTYYGPGTVQRSVSMILKAVGMKANGGLARMLAWGAYRLVRRRARRLCALAAA